MMALVVVLAAYARPAEAQTKGQGPIALFLTYKLEPHNRPALREYLPAVAAQFEKWKSEGVFKDFTILFPSYVHMNSVPWDMLVRLDFVRYADTDNWRKIERTMPGGLPAKALALASPESSYVAEAWAQAGMRPEDAATAFYSVSAYKFKVGPEVGRPFVRAYVQPQLEPFVRDKVIAGYGIYMNLHDLSDWSYMIVFEYADTAAFANRNKAPTRGPLTDDPAWMALHGMKSQIRDEMGAFFAERILPR